MGEIIRNAGWPIYPVLFFGGIALVLGVRHALVPQRSLLPLLVGFAAATIVMGCLGTSLGVQHTIEGIRERPDLHWMFVLGLGESLNNFSTALFLVLPATLAAAFGSWRMARRLEAIETPSGVSRANEPRPSNRTA